MPQPLKFSSGDFDCASEIMTEAAVWLASKGQALWPAEEVGADRLRARAHPDEVIVGYLDGIPIVAALLQWIDPLFWPGKNDSGFIHKLAVRRDFSGLGYPTQLLTWSTTVCKAAHKRFLRLDCDAKREKLRQFYENFGFRAVGPAVVAPHYNGTLYELDLSH